jgi:hypothetical protein
MSTGNSDSTFAGGEPTAARQSNARLLRPALLLDAVVTAANGVAYLAAPGLLGELLGLRPLLLQVVGAFLVVFGGFVFLVARPSSISHAVARAVVGANVIWAAASVLVLLVGALAPSTMGTVWVVLQAAAVAALAALQAHALR